MQRHQLQRKNPNKPSRRVGRGGKRGKTSGRGTKGQKARAGRKIRPEVRDLIKKIPKLRGYSFKSFRPRPAVLNVGALNIFEDGALVTVDELIKRGLINDSKSKVVRVKLLGDGALERKLTIEGLLLSGTAKEKIEKAGGTIAKAKT